MRNFIILSLIATIVCLSSCRSDFEFEASNGGLRFSKDTVYLDTVFTNIGSSTYTLKVYNKSNKNISIPTIQLGKGLDSKYRMTVDGMTGENNKIFHNVEMLAKDSLYIFIETTASVTDANPTDFLYTDQIQFGSGTNLQKVELVTLIQDAVFLFPQRLENGETEGLIIGNDTIKGFVLDSNDPVHGDEYHFTNQKPYVIYGYAAVDNNKTLNIDPGAHIYFHDSSGIIVAQGGTINVNGTPSSPGTQDGEVVFEGDRLEPDFSDTPGQWGTIWLTQGSTGTFNNAIIKNNAIGLYIQNNSGTVSIKNTQFYNCSNYGILAQTATIAGENVVINSTGKVSLACTLGGSYDFTHCTINNYTQSSNQQAVVLNNYYLDDSSVEHIIPLTHASFVNSIIYGSNQFELLLDKSENTPDGQFIYNFNHCLIRFNQYNSNVENDPLYNFADASLYNSCYIASDSFTFRPHFWNANKNELNIDLESEAIGKADTNFLIPKDVINNDRTTNDLGAYQSAAQSGN
jgi:hypothetical protein